MNAKVNLYAINIGRQLGSGGRQIGKLLAEKLNIHFYDKKLIEIAAQESGLSKEFFEKADEKASQPIFRGVIGARFPISIEGATPIDNCLSNDALFKTQSDVIQRLAQESSAIFVGRCADYILRDHKNSLNIFICASIDERSKRVSKLHSISTEEALHLIEKEDKKRADYYNYYSYKKWGDANSYDLCINSSVLGIEGTADFLYQFIKTKF